MTHAHQHPAASQLSLVDKLRITSALMLASAVLLALDRPAGRLVFFISAPAGLVAAGYMAFVGGMLLFFDRTAALADGWGWLLPTIIFAGVYLAAGFFIVSSKTHLNGTAHGNAQEEAQA